MSDINGTRVPVQTIPGTSLLVGALDSIKARLKSGHLADAQIRLDELLASISISPAPFTADDFEGPEHAHRTDHQVLVSIANLLEENLAELKHLRSALVANAGSVPSVEITVTSATKDVPASVKPAVKIYDPDPEHASQEAQRIFDELVCKYAPKAAGQ